MTAVKPSHKIISTYYATLAKLRKKGATNELELSPAFRTLLFELGKKQHWTLITEAWDTGSKGKIRPDGTLRDVNSLPRGYWEAKDPQDDLDLEVARKKEKDYPLSNIIFEDTEQAILYQNGQESGRFDITNKAELADLLNSFFSYAEPHIDGFEKAVVEFKDEVPRLAEGLLGKIAAAHEDNPAFAAAYESFITLCKTSLNPNLSTAAVDEMLVQHLLTERLIRTVFDNADFLKRNVIALQVEEVIQALVSKSFNRHEYLKSLDRFYLAIEDAARSLSEFSDKQHFLNTVYEQFFQGFSVNVADTHGIVYTPQPIVDFMCSSVVEVLKNEFGLELGDEAVQILDPCTGTGNFIVNLLERIPKTQLDDAYKNRLFANEVMLLPYYIASLNIEHKYYELSGKYEPFEGLCFVDTLDLAENKQLSLFSEKNTERVERQKESPITVIIGNPPYNAGQINENDNNKNRKYPVIDRGVCDTYARASKATLKNALYDPYVKFIRWATDRLDGKDGIVCFVTNNSFMEQHAFGGMREHLHEKDFTKIYHVDLHGNVRQNPKLSGTTHNVFGIQVGVGITVAVRKKAHKKRTIQYYRVEENWWKEEKYDWLIRRGSITDVMWTKLKPDDRHTWIVPENAEEFAEFVSIGNKEAKSSRKVGAKVIFQTFSPGVLTSRDSVVYDFDRIKLVTRIKESIEDYNAEVDRYVRAGKPNDVDGFVKYEDIAWSESLKLNLKRSNGTEFDSTHIRESQYRPFCNRSVYFDALLNERRSLFPYFFPTTESEEENQVICTTGFGSEKSFTALVSNRLRDYNAFGPGTASQCFPFYTYDEDGSNRKENITDWALKGFRKHYGDNSVTKWDIFYYAYALLHHPAYKEKFADNLKRELPRIPYAPHFREYVEHGRKLAKLHLEYEDVKPYKLLDITNDNTLSFHVDAMKLSKDKTELIINDSLTLGNIPPKVYGYRLGNRSALEWVIDQYRVKTDKRSGIVSDPNRRDDERYIVNLVKKVVTVSMDTVAIIEKISRRDFSDSRS